MYAGGCPNKPETAEFVRGIERSVVHHGSSTGFCGTTIFANGPQAISAAVLYESVVIESNDRTKHPATEAYNKDQSVFFAVNSGARIYRSNLPTRLTSWFPQPEHPKPSGSTVPPPAPTPSGHAQLVMIVNNSGKMDQVAQATTAFLSRLSGEDSVSLITLIDEHRPEGRHVWVFRDLPGDRAREEIRNRVATLFAVRRPLLPAAVEDAFRHLDRESKGGLVPTVVVLPIDAADRDALNRGAEGHRPFRIAVVAPGADAGAVWRATLVAYHPPKSADCGLTSASL